MSKWYCILNANMAVQVEGEREDADKVLGNLTAHVESTIKGAGISYKALDYKVIPAPEGNGNPTNGPLSVEAEAD